MTKKALMFVVMLTCTLSGLAEEKIIELEKAKLPHGRSVILLPTASIDGEILTVNLVEDAEVCINIFSSTGEIAYSISMMGKCSITDLQSLDNGEYRLEIVQGGYVYTGEFEIR